MGVNPSEIYCIGSSERFESICNFKFKIYTFESLPKLRNIECYYDYAFLTKDIENLLLPSEYVRANTNIINKSENFIGSLKPKYIFLSSSGAIYDTVNSTPKRSLYGDLKLQQEERYKSLVTEIGSKLSICRIFNISGKYLEKVNTYALTNFLTTSYFDKTIKIDSQMPVIRRYCSSRELVELVTTMAESNFSCDFDSGGYEVELKDLAILVAKIVNNDTRIERNIMDLSLSANIYKSNNDLYEQLLIRFLNKKPMSLQQQIKAMYVGMFA
jgi:nucleoside-diphosphate-sugar epimerase